MPYDTMTFVVVNKKEAPGDQSRASLDTRYFETEPIPSMVETISGLFESQALVTKPTKPVETIANVFVSKTSSTTFETLNRKWIDNQFLV
jgi:hypothetical protein